MSIAENPEDKLRMAALETLGELCELGQAERRADVILTPNHGVTVLRDISLVVHAEGLRVVLRALSDGPYDVSPHLAACFVYVMDRPGTRQYLRPGVDVEVHSGYGLTGGAHS